MNNLTETKSATMAHTSTTGLVLDTAAMQAMTTMAETMAKATIQVPKHLVGKPADCLAVVMQAAQWQMNPFAVAQKTHLVNGQLGYEAQLVNAVVSSSKAVQGRFKYEYGGDWSKPNSPDAWVRCGAVLRGESEITWGEPLYPATITTKNSPLWKTNPKQQASYLAVKYWARLYTPDVILGVYSTDEFEDSPVKEREVNPVPAVNTKSEILSQIINETAQEQPEDELSQCAADFMAAIESCSSVEELRGVSAQIGPAVESGNLSTGEREQLLKLYQAKQTELKG